MHSFRIEFEQRTLRSAGNTYCQDCAAGLAVRIRRHGSGIPRACCAFSTLYSLSTGPLGAPLQTVAWHYPLALTKERCTVNIPPVSCVVFAVLSMQ